jgi:hypothetical protein
MKPVCKKPSTGGGPVGGPIIRRGYSDKDKGGA